MPSLHNLPDFLLESVISYVIGVQNSSNTSVLRTNKTFVIEELEDTSKLYQPRDSAHSTEALRKTSEPVKATSPVSPALALLLSSWHINILTTRVIRLRAVFRTGNHLALERFLDMMGSEDLELVRNMDVNLYADFDDDHWWWDLDPYRPGNREGVVQNIAALKARLPSQLRCLRIEAPFHRWWPYSETDLNTDPELRAALSRLFHLRELELDFDYHLLHLDKFCSAGPSFKFGIIDQDVLVPSLLMFPSLR